MHLLASEISAEYYTRSPGIVSLLMLTVAYRRRRYTHTYICIYVYICIYIHIHIHTQGRLNNLIVHSLYSIMVMATSVAGVMKMGNIVPTSLVFWASVLAP